MIILYTDKSKIPDGYKLIENNDAYFDASTSYEITEEDIEIMNKVDKVKSYDFKTRNMETEFGATDITHLSTGCKTILNLIHLKPDKKQIISLNECGATVLNIIFSILSDKEVFIDIIAELMHTDDSFTFNINNTGKIVDKFYLMGEL